MLVRPRASSCLSRNAQLALCTSTISARVPGGCLGIAHVDFSTCSETELRTHIDQLCDIEPHESGFAVASTGAVAIVATVAALVATFAAWLGCGSHAGDDIVKL